MRKPKIKNNFAYLLFSTCFALSTATLAQAVNATEKGIYLYQTSGLLGDLDVVVSPVGVKIVAAKTGTVTVATPPEWKIVTYNPRTKNSFSAPLKSFSGYLPPETFQTTGLPWSQLPLVQSKIDQVAGVAAEAYVTPSNFTEKQLKDQSNECADSAFISSAKFVTAKGISAPPQAYALLNQFHCLPNKGALPLKFQYKDMRGNLNTMLVTSQCKPIDVSKSDFIVPSDLKVTSSIFSVHETKTLQTVRKKRPLL
ncbi:MAG: hypothetical protein IPG59_13105 [Candidatus Melainabacteria bacterium]|nr:MAG: hypothetical protein IPG59_13105 [Candidatus Melainabacteria bacterium]